MTTAYTPAKPLVLLEPHPAAAVVAQRLPEPDPALVEACACSPHCETVFRDLRRSGRDALALRFLTAALRRRVVVWWAYSCVREVRRSAAAHRAALAARGEPGTLDLLRLGAAPQAPGAVLGFDTTLPVSAKDFEAPPPVVGGRSLADPAAWPAARLDQEHNLRFLPAELEPVLQAPLREPSVAERFFLARKAHIESLAPAERAAWLANDARSAEAYRQTFGLSAGAFADKVLDAHFAATGHAGDDGPASPHQRLKQALELKKTELQQSLDGWKARFDLAMLALPKAAPADLSCDSPAVRSALAAARAWILDPSRAKGLAAMELGRKCEGLDQAAGMVAMACHFNGGDLNPPGTPADVPPVPPPPATAPTMVFVALELAKAIPDSGRTPEQWLGRFLDLGVEIAQGLRTWDALLDEREEDEHPWAGRPGFGRLHARPAGPPPGGTAWGM
ncbi:MAG: hypothetical protein L6R48_00450 [Planctomycetes bacterium]|nr:hypothetical protein [Planctomycetota bacterium]